MASALRASAEESDRPRIHGWGNIDGTLKLARPVITHAAKKKNGTGASASFAPGKAGTSLNYSTYEDFPRQRRVVVWEFLDEPSHIHPRRFIVLDNFACNHGESEYPMRTIRRPSTGERGYREIGPILNVPTACSQPRTRTWAHTNNR